MTQHILDRKRDASAPRAPQYLERDRAQGGPHVSTRSLLERGRTEPARLDVFSRLDRQQARDTH
ncbi:hypothetical protein HUK65_12215 [Rhodobacteraceae bacterium 2376]|uniref:Uncharacterized protein n=1 Tax=Rhabdonatronobacter sediminivivens TaxID=2743469 RepID=A0A7Z0I0Q5_9RHOB|nr:hypothetical protein [Rhabdonatronobacter sediminivivens]NYS25758.1 hypothetical protein [Rhabdonatronobacter sediminivivens]